ncbi:MAG: carbamoyl transferase, partial [bacterium]|nr:carbamoyl transferase [bacterium]
LCHAGSAYYVAPYDEACVITVDGIGEFASTWMGYGKKSELVSLKEIDYPNSLGFLWEKFSEYLGFDRYSGPGKLMGYSAITDSIGQTGVDYLSRMREIVTPESMGFTLDNRILRFRTGDFTGLENLFGPRRNRVVYRNEEAAIASALQEMTEEIMVHLAQQLYKKVKDQLGHPVSNLCLAGGVALNCLANSAILQKTSFTGLYIQPAANDAGTSLGAAFHVWHHHLGNKEKGHVMQHAYTGPEYGEAEIETMLRQQGWEYTRPDDIERTMARLIYDGQVTARYSGALEFGPRALGNRSIVCDPTRFDMREIINTRVKYRESFRPFAPSVLENSMKDLFEDGPAVPADKFMLLVYRTKGREHLRIPAVVQEDECRHINTARAQVVSAEVNPSYNRLIEEFKELSGVGAVLNTSFNIKEPLVCTPGDALKTFNKSGIDVLNMGPFLVKKNA